MQKEESTEGQHPSGFHPFEAKLAQSYAAQATKDDEQVRRILAFGDSLTEGYYQYGMMFHSYAYKLRELLEQDTRSEWSWAVVQKGRSGETTEEMMVRLPRLLNAAPTPYDFVFILGGTNDLGRSEADEIADNLIALHRTILERSETTRTLAISIPEHGMEKKHAFLESRRLAVNEKLKQFAEEQDRVEFFDLAHKITQFDLSEQDRDELWDDSIHFSFKGYDRFGELLFAKMKEVGWL